MGWCFGSTQKEDGIHILEIPALRWVTDLRPNFSMIWCGNRALKEAHPNFYGIARMKESEPLGSILPNEISLSLEMYEIGKLTYLLNFMT